MTWSRWAAALLATGPGLAPDGQPWSADGLATQVRPSDIAVLCRKRSQFVALRHALEARGIPVEVVGLGGLLAVPEVQDVVATLRVLHDAGASDALARLLTGPRWRIGPRDLVALGRRARALASGEGDGRAVTRSAAVEADATDALAEAITDLTAETGSLVEALDDLGEPSAYSPAGYRRMHALAGELRRLRAHVGRPLADLTAEAERVLALDIEVAARPGVDPVAARADLDAFTDVADAFTEGAEPAQLASPKPTLGAFLAYLAAAQQEEFGLETGRVGESDSVKLLTVHAAKGLQWPAVFVPGLSVGERSQVFPAKPRVSTRWTDNPRLIPFGLRGDAGDLPELLGLDAASLEAFADACAARDLSEERRLMYVAATRAAFWLGCSGYWWGEGGSSRLGPSPFLEEVRKSGAAQILTWADEPEEGAENPLLAAVDSADWPSTPAGRNYEAVREAARLVVEAMPAGGTTPPDPPDHGGAARPPIPP
ncbi:MAG: ATP-dependent helicase, partial [Actinobacteria bacterium]|nr:ATP-dependent helicase [Actinomycetota bacterium]